MRPRLPRKDGIPITTFLPSMPAKPLKYSLIPSFSLSRRRKMKRAATPTSVPVRVARAAPEMSILKTFTYNMSQIRFTITVENVATETSLGYPMVSMSTDIPLNRSSKKAPAIMTNRYLYVLSYNALS